MEEEFAASITERHLI